MSDIFSVRNFVYHDIDDIAKKVYDSYMVQMPKPAPGKAINVSPVLIEYKMTGALLSIKIGIHEFSIVNNKHFYLETLYERNLTIDDINILLYFKSEQGLQYLTEFSNAAWERMDESYEGHVADTIFVDARFPPFSEDYIIQIIMKLQKL